MNAPQTPLINLAKKLGYTQDIGGLCHGVTLKCLEAYLLGEQNKVIKRINKIMKTPHLDKLIRKAEEKRKNHEPLTYDDLENLEILPFCDDLFLYQIPPEYSDVFNKVVNQPHSDQASRLAASDAIQDKGGLATIYSRANIYTETEITAYFEKIKTIVRPYEQDMASI